MTLSVVKRKIFRRKTYKKNKNTFVSLVSSDCLSLPLVSATVNSEIWLSCKVQETSWVLSSAEFVSSMTSLPSSKLKSIKTHIKRLYCGILILKKGYYCLQLDQVAQKNDAILTLNNCTCSKESEKFQFYLQGMSFKTTFTLLQRSFNEI